MRKGGFQTVEVVGIRADGVGCEGEGEKETCRDPCL